MKVDFSCLDRRLPALVFCCFLLAGRGAAQTGTLVTYYDGSQQTFSAATSGKLYFDNGNLQIAVSDAFTAVSIPVSIIRKITFSAAAAPLPLRMLEFTARNDKDGVTLNWKTENEINTSHFVVQRSADGNSYESIGQVASLNNNTGGTYAFSDQAPKTGIVYYRLKQVDADGKYGYSKVVTVKRTSANNITLLPNPAGDYIKINSTTPERLNVKIYAMDGQLMIAGVYAAGEQISIGKLAAGMYLAFINNEAYKLIKQ